MTDNTSSKIILAKLRQFCIENRISNLVCMLQTKEEQTIVAKVFPFGAGYPFYIQIFKSIEKAVQDELVHWHCNHCDTFFNADELEIVTEGMEFINRCPNCHSEKIEIL